MFSNKLQVTNSTVKWKSKWESSIFKYNETTALVSPIYAPSLPENIIVYTPSQGIKTEKYFNHNKHKAKNADSGEK